MSNINVLVSGAGGRMGRTVMSAVMEAGDMTLVGGVDPGFSDTLLCELVAGAPREAVAPDVETGIERFKPDVMVDFTTPTALMHNLPTALTKRVACVVGTTGFSEELLREICALCEQCNTPAVIAPNFSIGANLMMKFAAEASALMDYAAIIEAHHENKLDAPSGTALATVERMRRARGDDFAHQQTQHFALEGVRGGEVGGISVQAIRMAGVVANQTVLLGGPGETLRIEHVTTGRECFMPGVLLAVREVRNLEGLTFGLDELLMNT
ncbi:MAG: 4-hydroxy-tetrahydrodipicolinate reductase [candidate division WS1 bacterium]|jgi:4-hydroxy-tetrahydrodipicolinate reductase|nr:4-hydroxy-tetrahydrodipicolinate reductase [candidate division WS1 bacterium]